MKVLPTWCAHQSEVGDVGWDKLASSAGPPSILNPACGGPATDAVWSHSTFEDHFFFASGFFPPAPSDSTW